MTEGDDTVVGRLDVTVVNSVSLVFPSKSGGSKSTFQPIKTSAKDGEKHL